MTCEYSVCQVCQPKIEVPTREQIFLPLYFVDTPDTHPVSGVLKRPRRGTGRENGRRAFFLRASIAFVPHL